MTKEAQALCVLHKEKKEMSARLAQKKKEVDHSLSKEITKRREEESQKRILNNSNVEQRLQRVTSALMLELMEICSKEEVPRYVVALAKVLDNYQGN